MVWSPALAYAVGLIATDGCLSVDGRHIVFVSKDEDLVRTFLECVQRPQLSYRLARGAFDTYAYRVDMSHAALYRWLRSVGLMPRKSLILGGIDVPAEHLMAVVRGLLDGDGTIYTRIHRPTRSRYPGYEYERLWTFFNSASRRHIDWLTASLRGALGIAGYVEVLRQPDHATMWRLKYGNVASVVLLQALYADEASPRLVRKWRKWTGYLERHPLCGRRDLNPHDLSATRP